MASFTDLIPQFNPYIQQLPVDAMVQVGMEKQKRYDEGIQKLQSQIDQVAGLSVLRDVDRAYLQSRVNELGNNLKGVAAGDFSNFQLVNSVGGMIGQISKDPFVMAAVKSTAQDQKNAEFMESERKAGKLDPANAYVYGLQRNKYLNSGLKDADGRPVTFSGQYEPYKNVTEKLRTIAKDVGVDEKLVQNLFNPDGTVNKVMVETLVKGKNANKIYDAFMNGLDAGDYRQLEINGIYKYRNTTPQEVLTNLDVSNKEYIQTSLNKKADIETEIANLKEKLPSAKADVAAEIESRILSLQATMKTLDDGVASSNKNLLEVRDRIASGDEDYLNSIKGKIHTNNVLSSLSRDFAESVSHVKYSENPLWKAIMEENKFIFDKWYKTQDLDIKRRKAAAAEKANELTEKQMFPIKTGTGALPGDQVSFTDQVNQDLFDKTTERNQKLVELARWDMKRLGWDATKMKKWAQDQAKSRGQSEEEVMAAWGATTLTNINSGKIKKSSEIAQDVDNVNNMSSFINGFQNLVKDADNRAKEQGGEGVTNVSDILREAKPVIIDANVVGREITLSPTDQLDIVRYTALQRELFSTKVEDKERELAKTRLENKYGKEVAQRLVGWAESQIAQTPGSISSNRSLLNPAVLGLPFGNLSLLGGSLANRLVPPKEGNPFQKLANAYTGENYEKFKQTQEQVYRETFSALYPKNETFVLTEKSRPTMQAGLTTWFIDRPDYADIKTKFDDPKSQVVVTTTPSMTGFGGTTLSMRIVGDKGETTAPIEISLQQYQAMFNKNPDAVNPAMSLVRGIVQGSPDNSSNSNGLGSVPTSFFKRGSFPYLTPQYNILGGDFVQSSDGSDLFFPKLYYVPKGINDTVTLDVGKGMSLVDVLDFPTMVDDNKVGQIIRNQ